MEYLLEVSRIIDGAVKGDRAKVAGYVQQLIRKLRESGEEKAADRLNRVLSELQNSDMRLSGSNGQLRLPVDHDSRLSLGDESWIRTEEVEVILNSGVRERVEEFLTFVRASDELLANRVGVAPSMILYGPPGIGKTELARYIAAQLQLPLITARSDSLISSFLGNTAKNLRMLFEHAMSRPCVLFLDELDSVAKLRDDHHEMGELKRVVVSLLQNIDALGNETVLLAATNHQHLLDPAIWRRFAYRLEMKLPNYDERTKMFAIFLADYVMKDDLLPLAAASEGLSGADLKMISNAAIRSAVVRGEDMVRSNDVLRGLVRSRLGETFPFALEEPTQVHAVRDLDPKVFTVKRLAALFETSEPTISRRLKDAGVTHGRTRSRPTTTTH